MIKQLVRFGDRRFETMRVRLVSTEIEVFKNVGISTFGPFPNISANFAFSFEDLIIVSFPYGSEGKTDVSKNRFFAQNAMTPNIIRKSGTEI